MIIKEFPVNANWFILLYLGISTSVASKAHDVGKMVFTTVKAEFQKKSEISTASMPWKLQTVSACIDLMVWTTEQDDQGNSAIINFSKRI